MLFMRAELQQPTATATLLGPPPFLTSFAFSQPTSAIPKGLEKQELSEQQEFLFPSLGTTVKFPLF